MWRWKCSWRGIAGRSEQGKPILFLAQGRQVHGANHCAKWKGAPRRVLPVPGGPTRRTPEGARAPSFVNLSGDLSSSCKDIHSDISDNAIAASRRNGELRTAD